MKTYIKILIEVIKKNRILTCGCILVVMVMSALQVIIPLSMKEMLARIEMQGTVAVFLFSVVTYIILWMIYNLVNVQWYKQIDILGESVLWHIRERIYDVIFDCNKNDGGATKKEYLKNIIFTDVISIYGNIILYSFNIFADLFIIVAFIGVSFTVDILTTIILIVTVVGGLGLSVLTKQMMAECSRNVNSALKRDNAVNNECVDAIEYIKVNGLQDYYKKKVRDSIHNFIKIAIKSDQKLVFVQNIMNSYHQIIVMLITAFLFLNQETANSGNLVYYIFVANLVVEKSQNIESNFYKFLKNMAAFDNVKKYYDVDEKEKGVKRTAHSVSNVEFQNVNISYGKEIQVLRDISFLLKKGDAVLIRGENGSGKTTLLKLMAGLIEPLGGDILYDGKSYKEIDRNSLYKSICYLGQDEMILNENLQNYLTVVTHKDISEKRYQAYAERVGLTKELTSITENGRHLSGGEKKKIIIMKLLARLDDVSIILLDEVEAGLDKQSQRLLEDIEEEILNMKEKYIILRITHENVKHEKKYNRVIDLT